MEELGNYSDIDNPLDFSLIDGLDGLPGQGPFPANTNHNELGLGTPVSDWNGTWGPPDSPVNPGSHGKSLNILDGNARNEIMGFAEEVKQHVAERWETQRERDAALRILTKGLDPTRGITPPTMMDDGGIQFMDYYNTVPSSATTIIPSTTPIIPRRTVVNPPSLPPVLSPILPPTVPPILPSSLVVPPHHTGQNHHQTNVMLINSLPEKLFDNLTKMEMDNWRNKCTQMRVAGVLNRKEDLITPALFNTITQTLIGLGKVRGNEWTNWSDEVFFQILLSSWKEKKAQLHHNDIEEFLNIDINFFPDSHQSVTDYI